MEKRRYTDKIILGVIEEIKKSSPLNEISEVFEIPKGTISGWKTSLNHPEIEENWKKNGRVLRLACITKPQRFAPSKPRKFASKYQMTQEIFPDREEWGDIINSGKMDEYLISMMTKLFSNYNNLIVENKTLKEEINKLEEKNKFLAHEMEGLKHRNTILDREKNAALIQAFGKAIGDLN